MRQPARVTTLGSGTSHGVPMIGCTCATCRSTDPRDQRLRPSIHVAVAGRASILIDTSPDLRQQALRHHLTRIDAVLFTHSHADHILGFDELRRFNVMQGGPMPCYADAATWETLRRTFYYVFDGHERQGGGIPQVEAHLIDGPLQASGISWTPVPLLHGTRPILGFRSGGFAYLTDASAIPDASWPLIDGVDTLIINALRHRLHPTHFSLTEALAAVARIAPRHTFLTHMCHDLPHAETSAQLPGGVELLYDGLVLDVEVDVV